MRGLLGLEVLSAILGHLSGGSHQRNANEYPAPVGMITGVNGLLLRVMTNQSRDPLRVFANRSANRTPRIHQILNMLLTSEHCRMTQRSGLFAF